MMVNTLKKQYIISGILLVFLFAGGCASYQDIQRLSGRIAQLEQKNAELMRKADELNREKTMLSSRLTDLSKGKEQEENYQTRSAKLFADITRIREEIKSLQGQMDTLEHRQTQMRNHLDKMETNAEHRLGRIESQINFGTPPYSHTRPEEEDSPGAREVQRPGHTRMNRPSSQSPEHKEPAIPEQNAGVSDQQRLYDAGKRTFSTGDYPGARTYFQELIRKFPGSQYADNAQYWIGETFYKEGNYKQAILEYQSVIERYPTGNKVRASLLKQGFAFANMGDYTNARLFLQELMDKYPNSEEAKIAKDKLETF